MTTKKPKEEKFEFSTVLMVAGMPTVPNGEIYTIDVMRRILERITLKPKLIIQEMNQVERKLKKIHLAEPWNKKIMADIIHGEIIDNKLVIHCLTRLNRDGRKLAGIIKENGIETIEFFPVGYGTLDEYGKINPDYRLNYVAMEPKNF